MKLTKEFFKEDNIIRISKGFMGEKILLLWLRIVLNKGIDLSLPKKEQRAVLCASAFTLKRGIKLFQKLKMLDKYGNIIDERESRRKYSREYMRSYRKSQGTSELEKAVNKVKKQIDFEHFSKIEQRQAEEMVLIIAEVFCLKRGALVLIEGVETDVSFLLEVYKKLRHSHIAYALERYHAVDYEVKKVKDFLRTLLYNVYFEMEPAYTNRARAYY